MCDANAVFTVTAHITAAQGSVWCGLETLNVTFQAGAKHPLPATPSRTPRRVEACTSATRKNKGMQERPWTQCVWRGCAWRARDPESMLCAQHVQLMQHGMFHD